MQPEMMNPAPGLTATGLGVSCSAASDARRFTSKRASVQASPRRRKPVRPRVSEHDLQAAEASVAEMERLSAVFSIKYFPELGWRYTYEAPEQHRWQCRHIVNEVKRRPDPAYSLFKVAVWVSIHRRAWGMA